MFIVTGGAGFIGSNIVKGLNNRGFTDVVIVDDLTQGEKMHNLADLDFTDYIDIHDFLEYISSERPAEKIKAVFHQGASTQQMNGTVSI